ncbi:MULTISPECIES: formyltetrahydrofolate deformylase [unclassified Arcicella]|uniref:formyltetrahydrofolate deformylase n=1 Tax=unclassified Arcicella TaxID=2644986 RepID=UPI002860935C|nr:MULTISPECIES: formyltetrahydrofolate deformylase [unclassified Arcicella]MDR6560170.1 formyltetrahydrofolate deformylase [Arcicella sp. BE51]MDR6810223.1 formyltetrahydrofolate deformylase [Arcicella sp. BE140]MDR6821573.1 formyltetrahydrofolate deformylase [Arcicella sp. BE139]
MTDYILRIDCTDEKGLVHKITGVLFFNNLNIERTDEFVDVDNNLFFMRVAFSGDCDPERIEDGLRGILPSTANIDLTTKQVKDVVVLVTKEHHCLSDLLIRNEFNDLPFNILAVIGNHEVLRPLTEKFNIPFHHVPAEGITRAEHEKQIEEVVTSYSPDYLILAKFMRILTPEFTKKFSKKVVNIHHSFLPAFIGANPYKQAHHRGVKIIGATAHFVTDDLDEGPIIFQDITRVDHTKNALEMAQAGRDVEKIVLAKALKFVFEDRVFIHGNKTIIFE